MLVKDHEETTRKLENMSIAHFPAMCLFSTAISENTLTVTYRAPETTISQTDTLSVPLDPEDFEHLERVDIDMYSSPTKGYDMGSKYGQWFSQHFGFKVILVFWGANPRLVLGNLPGKPPDQGPKPPSFTTNILTSIPIIGPWLEEAEEVIAFNDCAPYLVINENSVQDVSSRLPEGVEMDLTKFRANIVLNGSDPAYSEDFWGELKLGMGGARIILTGMGTRLTIRQ